MAFVADAVPWVKLNVIDAAMKLSGKSIHYQNAYLKAHLIIGLYRAPIPGDIEQAARLLGLEDHADEVRNALVDSFNFTPAGWITPDLQNTIAVANELREKRAQAGRSGGIASGKQRASKRLATAKQGWQPPSNDEANAKQTRSNTEANTKEEKELRVRERIPSVSSLRSDTAASRRDSELVGDKDQWDRAINAFMRQGRNEPTARSHIGKLVRDFGPKQTFRLLEQAIEADVPDLGAYVEKAGQRIAQSAQTQIERMTDDEIEAHNRTVGKPLRVQTVVVPYPGGKP
jgi:hypothetical protein